MTTKSLAVKLFLRDILKSSDFMTQESIQVTYGFPTRAPERKWALVGEIRWNNAEWVTNRSRAEEFTIAVAFNVMMGGGTSEESEAYVIAMGEEFERVLKANPGLSGLCTSTDFVPRSLRSWPIDQAYEAQYETEVSAKCRP